MNSEDSGRLRFVTSAFLALQGLRMVPLGAYILVSRGLEASGLGSPLRDGLKLGFALLCLVLFFKARSYYERRYGRVSRRIFSLSNLRETLLLTVIAAVCWYLWERLGADFAALFLGCFFSLICIGSGGRRWYYLPFGALLITLAFLPGTALVDARMARDMVMGATFVITGILDHLLLAHSLPGLGAAGDA